MTEYTKAICTYYSPSTVAEQTEILVRKDNPLIAQTQEGQELIRQSSVVRLLDSCKIIKHRNGIVGAEESIKLFLNCSARNRAEQSVHLEDRACEFVHDEKTDGFSCKTCGSTCNKELNSAQFSIVQDALLGRDQDVILDRIL